MQVRRQRCSTQYHSHVFTVRRWIGPFYEFFNQTMKLFVRVFALACLFTSLAFPQTFSFAQAPAQTSAPVVWAPPAGFGLTLFDLGVVLFRKNYPGGTPDYVQMVMLDQGARVELMHPGVAEKRPGKGVFGGDDARFYLNSLPNYFYLARKSDPNAFCVSNGSFFYMPETPTRLPFPLKKDGVILTDGFGQDQYTGQKLILELWADHADIRPLTREALYNSTAPDILGGLAEDANKRAKFSVGRTFAGVQDLDGDGKAEALYLLNSQTHTQSSAAQVLRDFGAEKVIMLDGGGSTQLLCQGQDMIASERLIPQAVAVFAASEDLFVTGFFDRDGPPGVSNAEWGMGADGDSEPGFVDGSSPALRATQTVQAGGDADSSVPGNGLVGSAQDEDSAHSRTTADGAEDGASNVGEVAGSSNGALSDALSDASSGDSSGASSGAEALVDSALDVQNTAQNAAPDAISLRGLLYVPLIIIPLGVLVFLFFRRLRG